MSETAMGFILGKALVEKQELEALVAQYRDEHDERAQHAAANWVVHCACGLCDRAEGLEIPAVNRHLTAEDAVAELGRMA